MPQLQQSPRRYSLVAASYHKREADIEKLESNVIEKRLFYLIPTPLVSVFYFALALSRGLFLWSHSLISNDQAAFSPPASFCKDPSNRRELRTLSHWPES